MVKYEANEDLRKNIEFDRCPSSFKTKPGQKRHQLKAHKVSIFCDKCTDTFISTLSYNIHLRKNHPIKRLARTDGAKTYLKKKIPKEKGCMYPMPFKF